MRVRISYSVDIDDVPSEVAHMINKNNQNLHDAVEMIERALKDLETDKDVDVSSCASVIDKARQKLSSYDLVLQDAHVILSGFAEALDQLENPPPSQEPPIEADSV